MCVFIKNYTHSWCWIALSQTPYEKHSEKSAKFILKSQLYSFPKVCMGSQADLCESLVSTYGV